MAYQVDLRLWHLGADLIVFNKISDTSVICIDWAVGRMICWSVSINVVNDS